MEQKLKLPRVLEFFFFRFHKIAQTIRKLGMGMAETNQTHVKFCN